MNGDRMSNKTLISTATAHAKGADTAVVYLYDDGSLAYTTKLGIAKTRWQYAAIPRYRSGARSVSLASDGAGTLTVTVIFIDNTLAFAKIEQFFNWHFVNKPDRSP